MQENLKTTHYNNGDIIQNVADNDTWGTLTSGAYCWYDNNEATYGDTYGALNNWYTVNTGILCPAGWHVPSDGEWITLTDYLGGETDAGGKLKETETTHWNAPNTGATNETEFTALPAGYCSGVNGLFLDLGNAGYWWSSTQSWRRCMYNSNTNVYRVEFGERNGISVRCIKD